VTSTVGSNPTLSAYISYKYLVDYFGLPNMKTHRCGHCGETNPEKFYGHKKSVCGDCHNKYTTELGIKKREFVIEKLGGKCLSCGFDKYRSALQVHHLDPSKKDSNFRSMRGWSQQRILDEIKGCVLLCACCHAAVHSNELDLRGIV
jgi:hypothetical protein